MSNHHFVQNAIAVGNFDGFHIGHQKIINRLKEAAKEFNLTEVVLTFNPNPKIFFNREIELIMTNQQKERVLKSAGIRQVIFLNFPEVFDLSGEMFVREYLLNRYHMGHLIVGANFRFGKNRSESLHVLEEAAVRENFRLEIIDPVMVGDVRVSSTLIREKISRGEMQQVIRLLGRPYRMEGVVTMGDKLGRKLNYPTINLNSPNGLFPDNGVYRTRTIIGDTHYPSITYIGIKPTFDKQKRVFETHVLDFNEEVYDRWVEVDFLERIRGEMKFDSPEALARQIKKDIEALKNLI